MTAKISNAKTAERLLPAPYRHPLCIIGDLAYPASLGRVFLTKASHP